MNTGGQEFQLQIQKAKIQVKPSRVKKQSVTCNTCAVSYEITDHSLSFFKKNGARNAQTHVTFPLTSRGAHTNPPAFSLKSKAHPQKCTQIMSNPSRKMAGKQSVKKQSVTSDTCAVSYEITDHSLSFLKKQMAFGMHKHHVTFPLTSRGAHTNPPAFSLKSKAHPQKCTQIMSNPSRKMAGKQSV